MDNVRIPYLIRHTKQVARDFNGKGISLGSSTGALLSFPQKNYWSPQILAGQHYQFSS